MATDCRNNKEGNMKKSDLKELIKPLVKECIHEALIEEGLLASVVSEVAKGMQQAPIIESRVSDTPHRSVPDPQAEALLHEAQQAQRRDLMQAINKDAYNGVDLFEGTEPFTAHESAEPKPGSVELGNPRDPCVDISALMGNASKLWQAMK